MWLKLTLMLLILASVITIVVLLLRRESQQDHEAALRALEEFDHNAMEVTDEELDNLDIHLVQAPSRENYTGINVVDTGYWPYSYYYHRRYPGRWPPGMYSRMHHWSPGFSTAGWMYYLRPGISRTSWPENRWVRNNNSYYFVSNRSDYVHRAKEYV